MGFDNGLWRLQTSEFAAQFLTPPPSFKARFRFPDCSFGLKSLLFLVLPLLLFAFGVLLPFPVSRPTFSPPFVSKIPGQYSQPLFPSPPLSSPVNSVRYPGFVYPGFCAFLETLGSGHRVFAGLHYLQQWGILFINIIPRRVLSVFF